MFLSREHSSEGQPRVAVKGYNGKDGQPPAGQGESASGQAINIHKSLPHHDSQGRKQSIEAFASCDCWDLDTLFIDYAMVCMHESKYTQLFCIYRWPLCPLLVIEREASQES